MPRNANLDESHMVETCKSALSQKKPKPVKIAREFGVSRTTLSAQLAHTLAEL